MKRTPIRIWQIERPVNLLTMPEARWSAIASDWSGNSLPFRWEYFLALDEKLLHYYTRSTAPIALAPDAQANTFTPELWKYTVAEIFFFDKNREAYQEYNIAPNGAWWHSRFATYRAASESHPPEFLKVQPLSHRTSEYWISGFAMPRQNIANPLNLDSLRVSICGIVGHEEQVFLACNALADLAPDFHRKECAAKLEISSFSRID